VFRVQPFAPGFSGGVRVAVGDVNGDGTPDLITAAGAGGGPLVRVFDGRDGTELGHFLAFEPSFTGGLFVAAADLDGDGKAEIVVTPDQGGGPRVRVFGGADGGRVLDDFFAIDDPNFRGGARAAVGDVNGDGVADLVVGAGFGGGPRVAGFDGSWLGQGNQVKMFADFFAFEPTLRNGVYAAVGDVNGDGRGEAILGAGPGGAPRVLGLDGAALLAGQQTPVANFFAGDPAGRQGARVGIWPNAASAFTTYIAALNVASQTAAAYDTSGKKVQDLTPGGTGFVGSAPYDVADYKYTPTGQRPPLPPPPTTSPPPPGGDFSFNHMTAITNVIGTYNGNVTVLVTTNPYDPNSDISSRRVDVTLDIQSLTPQTPNRDPADSSPAVPSIYNVTARLQVQIAGLGFLDVQVTGWYKLTHFPDTFSAQTGSIAVGVVSTQTAPATVNGGDIQGDLQSGQITVQSAGLGKTTNGHQDWALVVVASDGLHLTKP
jgi:hypothetical protein